MITLILMISGIAVLEQVLGTLDLISTIQRRLAVNWVVVFLAILIDGFMIKVISENPKAWIIVTYALVSATASILTIIYERKARLWNIQRKKIKALEKARLVKKALQDESEYENGKLNSGNIGEAS